MTKKIFYYPIVFLVSVLIGFLISRQLVLTKKVTQALKPETNEALTFEISWLLSDNLELSSKVANLSGQKDKLSNIFGDRHTALETLDKNITNLEIATGEKAVTGPGVLVYINQDLALTQLVDLINAIRNSGAEAIALNNKRIVINTSLKNSGKPYTLQVIGDTEVLFDALTRRGGILDQIVEGEVTKHDRLILPAAG